MEGIYLGYLFGARDLFGGTSEKVLGDPNLEPRKDAEIKRFISSEYLPNISYYYR